MTHVPLSAEGREKQARKIIHTASATAAGASTLSVMALGDTVVLTSVSIGMVIALAKLFERSVDKMTATHILEAISGRTVGVTAARRVLGILPGIGTFANAGISAGYMNTLGWRVYRYFEENEDSSHRGSIETPARPNVFICYSHADTVFANRLLIYLKPIASCIEIFIDTMLKPGVHWRHEIETALRRTKIAVVFISADFLASAFIQSKELPELLEANQRNGAIIFPVLVSPIPMVGGSIEDILKYQTPYGSLRPLIKMKKPEREETFSQIAEAIFDTLKVHSVGCGS